MFTCFSEACNLTEGQEIKLPPAKSQQLAACRLLCHAAVIQSLSKPALHFDKAWESVTGLGRSRLTLIRVPKGADGV